MLTLHFIVVVFHQTGAVLLRWLRVFTRAPALPQRGSGQGTFPPVGLGHLNRPRRPSDMSRCIVMKDRSFRVRRCTDLHPLLQKSQLLAETPELLKEDKRGGEWRRWG